MGVPNFRELQDTIHNRTRSKGWWEGVDVSDPNVIGVKLMLIVSEASEALEDVRNRCMALDFDHDGKPIGFPSELADVVIHVMDLSAALGIDLWDVIVKKEAYNATRPHRHGGRAL